MAAASGAVLAAAVAVFSTDAAPDTTQSVAITVDGTAKLHPISPLIYGVNFGSSDALKDLRAPLNRSGGNSASAYAWRTDARNAGSDWYFESLPIIPTDLNDQFGANFVSLTRAGAATPIVTIPMLGRVAKLDPQGRALWSFSIAKYGAQPNHDVNGYPDAGNGIAEGGQPIAGNDPNDATAPDAPSDEQARVADLVARFGGAGAGGVRYYALDNEPSLWQNAHRDVHPTGAHANEIAGKVIAYSSAVKAADPQAQVMAPEEWGWGGYFNSGFDQQNGTGSGSDYATQTGGMPYVPWLLAQWKQAGRPIDVFSLHFYPQSGEYSDQGEAGTTAIQLARNRSTRDLWDPNYKDPSWINSVVALIPTMRNWVNAYYYPGTPIAITEYSWGGDTLMNGATAQADILGIFGREGLDMATRWGTLDPATPVYKAIKLYRNYDGRGGQFGDTSIGVSVPDPDTVSAFGALRTLDGAATVMIVNKQLSSSADVTMTLVHLPRQGKAQVWRLANNTIARVSDLSYKNGTLRASLPPQSVALFVLQAA